MSAMHLFSRRSAVVFASTGALCLASLGGAASAVGLKGIKGDPQPELKPFSIGPSFSTGGSAVATSNGDLVAAYDINNSGRTQVCVLARAKSACSHSSTLPEAPGAEALGMPAVFAPSANHVVIVQPGTGGSNIDGPDVLYSSTNNGVTFSAPVRVGTLGLSAAALIDGDVLFGTSGGDGTQVESIADTATLPGPVATLTSGASYGMAIGSYKNGALVASENGSNATTVDYAKAGSPFGAAGSYKRVRTFKNEDILAMSGSALLTEQSTGKYNLVLRLFNGTSFGSAHVVPGDSAYGGPVYYAVDQDASNDTHVFNILARKGYHMYEQSTRTGKSWTSPVGLGNAINSGYFNGGLDATGSGIVLGVAIGHGKAIAYPVLAAQSVTFSLSKSSVKTGHKVTGKGKGSAAAKGRKIELQVEKSGKWYDVASTKEKASGAFSFTIKGTSKETKKYRAVASDHAGYVEFGYSPARSLKVT
jgi:hypothetical protein